jgi:hypothetical protein
MQGRQMQLEMEAESNYSAAADGRWEMLGKKLQPHFSFHVLMQFEHVERERRYLAFFI